MARRPTPKQAAALRHLATHPAGTSPWSLTYAADIAGGFNNEQDFIDRLVNNDWVEVTATLTDTGRAALAALTEGVPA